MNKVIKFMEGKKTYACAALAGLLTVVYALGAIEQGAYITLMGLVFPAGLASLRNAKK